MMQPLHSVSQKKSPLELNVLLLNVCYHTSGNLNEFNMNSSSLRQNNSTKTIAQINDCLFIYMKFKAISHAQHVPHFGRRKEWFVCACGVLHYGSFQAAAVKH